MTILDGLHKPVDKCHFEKKQDQDRSGSISLCVTSFTGIFYIGPGNKNNHFTTWPRLTRDLIVKHLPSVFATVKGHHNQVKQNIQSLTNTSTYDKQFKLIRNNIRKIKQTLPPGK